MNAIGQARMGKRLGMRCNRWIRVGRRVTTSGGDVATISSMGPHGVTVSGAVDGHGWACTFPWDVVFRARCGLPAMRDAWRPADVARC